MAEDPLALSTIPAAPPVESDYDAICAAMMETERGRWFLTEYARRNRHVDTTMVLGAIARIESAIRGEGPPPPSAQLRFELMAMAEAIARTKADIAAIKPDTGGNGKSDDEFAPPGHGVPTDVLAAAERVLDIVWALRDREVDAALCDALAAAALEISTAVEHHDLAALRAVKAIQVLRHVEFRINDLIDTLSDPPAETPSDTRNAAWDDHGEFLVEPPPPVEIRTAPEPHPAEAIANEGANDEQGEIATIQDVTSADLTESFTPNTAEVGIPPPPDRAEPGEVEPASSPLDDVDVLLKTLPAPNAPAPEAALPAPVEDPAADLFEVLPEPGPAIFPLPEPAEAPAELAIGPEAAAAVQALNEARAADPIAAAAQIMPEGTAAPMIAAADAIFAAPPPAAPALSRLGPQPIRTPRLTLNDPMAAVHALSEEELIALFS